MHSPYTTPDHEGLQAVAVHRSQWPDHSGMTPVLHSDKEIMVTVNERSISPDQLDDRLPSYYQPPSSKLGQPRRYCGLSQRIFIFAVVLISCVVFGAAIGGGIGGATAGRQQTDPEQGNTAATLATSTSTSTSANHITTTTVTSATATTPTPTPTSTPTTGYGTYNCPTQNNTTYISPIDPTTLYTIICAMDQPGGVAGQSGGVVTNMNTGLVTDSIESCIDACIGYSTWSGRCVAVTYEPNITASLETYGRTGNCLFKDQRARDMVPPDFGQVVVSAFLAGEY